MPLLAGLACVATIQAAPPSSAKARTTPTTAPVKQGMAMCLESKGYTVEEAVG